jgi:hypothetical protein
MRPCENEGKRGGGFGQMLLNARGNRANLLASTTSEPRQAQKRTIIPPREQIQQVKLSEAGPESAASRAHEELTFGLHKGAIEGPENGTGDAQGGKWSLFET